LAAAAADWLAAIVTVGGRAVVTAVVATWIGIIRLAVVTAVVASAVISRRGCGQASGGCVTSASISTPGYSAIAPVK
jgi:hypothetical protein